MVKTKEGLISAYAFTIGVVLAVVFGFFNKPLDSAGELFFTALVFIGLIIGFLYKSNKNTIAFLFASLSLVIVGALGNDPLLYIARDNYAVLVLQNILGSLLVLFVPVTVIVSLKTVFSMAKI